jgi:hypothetical protein
VEEDSKMRKMLRTDRPSSSLHRKIKQWTRALSTIHLNIYAHVYIQMNNDKYV